MRPEWQKIADRYTDDDLIKGALGDTDVRRELWPSFGASYEMSEFLAQALAQRLKAYKEYNYNPQLP